MIKGLWIFVKMAFISRLTMVMSIAGIFSFHYHPSDFHIASTMYNKSAIKAI